ncbi:MAG: hypothetical protein KDD44_07410, partial [Bdellovibrionales bacterium]|nr:hypothetical protein [Bdellovibrionales bacterium]
ASKGVIRIGSKNFTEQFVLGELIAQSIERATPLIVERRFNLGSVVVCHRAMIHGDIDIYPEYTGTGFRVILSKHDDASPGKILRSVRREYRSRFDIQWLEPFGFNNTFAVAVRENYAEKNNLQTISDLRGLARALSFAMSPEFHERPDGFVQFTNRYQLSFGETREMDLALMYRAVQAGHADVLVGNSTDGRIPAYGLKILEDDRNFFPAYFAAPLVRREVLEQHPEIREALEPLAHSLNERTMQALNFAVDEQGKTPRAVARDFLEQHIWIRSPSGTT